VVVARYTAGLLVYVLSNGTMEAVRFDARARRVAGTPFTIATDVSLLGGGMANLAVSTTGTVVYVPEAPRSLLLVDRSGNTRPAAVEDRGFHSPRFSPDGRYLLTDFSTAEGRDVWRVDLAGGAMTRITFDRDGHDATWEPDGRHVTYSSAKRGGSMLTLLRTSPGRAAEPDSLIADRAIGFTGWWLPDASGIVAVGNSLRPGSRSDIVVIRNQGRGPIEPLVATRFDESFPAVSPDGRWLAYTSDQSGTNELYVRPMGREGEEVRVSLSGASEPLWSRDGRELYYRALSGGKVTLVAAALSFSPTLRVDAQRNLFDVSAISSSTPHTNYDISPDGRTFAMVRQNPAMRIEVIQNLPALFAQLERGGRR
jgi:Tol biopolymer transport system component